MNASLSTGVQFLSNELIPIDFNEFFPCYLDLLVAVCWRAILNVFPPVSFRFMPSTSYRFQKWINVPNLRHQSRWNNEGRFVTKNLNQHEKDGQGNRIHSSIKCFRCSNTLIPWPV
jgi:hypothetical protein